MLICSTLVDCYFIGNFETNELEVICQIVTILALGNCFFIMNHQNYFLKVDDQIFQKVEVLAKDLGTIIDALLLFIISMQSCLLYFIRA